jgi:hypothetical protein
VDFRPLPGVGHFVTLEAIDMLAPELRRAIASGDGATDKGVHWFSGYGEQGPAGMNRPVG